MKLDYNYFLQRRGLTTKSIVESNKLETYEELVSLLKSLRVIPPKEEDVCLFFITERDALANKKQEYEHDQKETKISSKKKSSRKVTSGNTSTKKVVKTPSSSTGTSSVRKKKPTK